MGLLEEEIIGLVIGKGDSKASSKFQELIREKKYKKFLEEIPGIIEEKVLFPAESETYFRDLQLFYLSKKVVAKFVISFMSTSAESVSKLSNDFLEEFIGEYPQHSIAKSRIKELLESSVKIIDIEIKNRKLIIEDQEIALFIAQNSKEILEGQTYIVAAVNSVRDQINEIQNDIQKITNQMAGIQKESDKNISSVLSIGQLVDNTEYAAEVKDIEENIQQKLQFSQAIVKYNELINDIKENIKNPNELLTHIYINLALCYANIDNYVRADRSLVYAQKYCDCENNAKYYYVKGYICWKKNKDNIFQASELLDVAISLDPKHFHAKMLRCQLGAFANEEKEKIMSILIDAEQDIKENNDRADLFQTKGLVYKAYGDFGLAEKWMLKAEQEKHSIENLINLGILYYNKATVNNEHGKRLLKIKIDYPEIFKAFECFQKVMQEITQDELNLYRNDFIEIYISTCILCEQPEQIENIQIPDEDRSTLDYEIQKSLIFYEIMKGKNENVDLLSEEDKIFLSYIEKAEMGQMEEAFQLVKENISQGSENDLVRKYNFALQLALELNCLEDFRQLRKNLIISKIECPYLDLYDAEYYDLTGNYEKSKEFYDSHIQENDGLYVMNAILFYKRHSYNLELKQAYCTILKKIGRRQIAIHRSEKIISDAFTYLAENDIDLAFDMMSCFDEATIKTESFQRISEMLYFKVMNVHELIKIYEREKDECKTFDQKINYIILLKYNLQYVKAKEEAEKMIKSYQKEDKDSQIKYLELLSELCLFTDEFDKSVEYITMAKDLAKDLVYNPVHQLFMSRLIRCGKKEGLSYGIEFKQTHPNVVNWMKQFQAIETNDQGEEKLTDEFLEIIENQKKHFETALSYYRNQSISFYQLQRLLGSDLLLMLSIPDDNNVKFVIGSGNIEQIEDQSRKLGDRIVIDVMTLLFLKYYGVFELLDKFSVIYVTYSSIEELEKIYIQQGAMLVKEMITWLKNDLRVELYPNYSNKSEEELLYHPVYFMDSLEAAKREKCQYLCIDARAPLFFSNDKKYFVNIMSIVHREEGEKLSILVTKLLAHNVTFINFRSDDITYSLDYEIDETIISKFFAIDCSCDSTSFISVYRRAIIELLSSEKSNDKMQIFLLHICEQIDRTFSRARMCRWRYEEYHNKDQLQKYEYYTRHNINLLFMLYKTIADNYDLWNMVCNYSYKYFDTIILKKLCSLLHKNKKIGYLDIEKGLIGYYSFDNDKYN